MLVIGFYILLFLAFAAAVYVYSWAQAWLLRPTQKSGSKPLSPTAQFKFDTVSSIYALVGMLVLFALGTVLRLDQRVTGVVAVVAYVFLYAVFYSRKFR